LNLFGKPERQLVEANIDPGLEEMMQYAKMERLNARLPPPDQVQKAFTDFFQHRRNTGQPVEDVQAQYALQALTYLCRQKVAHISETALRSAMTALRVRVRQPSSAHTQLVVAIYDTVRAIRQHKRMLPPGWLLTETIHALCSQRSTMLAREYLVNSIKEQSRDQGKAIDNKHDGPEESRLTTHNMRLGHWVRVLEGFNEEGNAHELHHTLEMMEEHGYEIESRPAISLIMAEFFSARDDMHSARTWYERAIQCPREPSENSTTTAARDRVQQSLLRLCMRTSQLELGQSIIRDITKSIPSKHQWDLIFEWAAGTGKGVDEVDRMMGVMEKANEQIADKEQWRLPDIETINCLVELAISRKDPYMAERFIALGRKRNIQPDARTLVLQIDYRLSVEDVDGALVAYKHLQTEDVSDNQDVTTVNRLICSMCASGRQDFDSIMNVAADLSDRRARFEPSTVSALSLLHLSRNELDDVADLLNTHVHNFSASERASVRQTFVDHCLNPSTSTASAWDAYTMLKELFDDMNREQRTRLMNEFFRRERADMAVHVFSHMRTHTRADAISTVDTYVACFKGIGSLQDAESLEVVHNQMKLDYSIEPNTHLFNSLIVSFTACNAPRRALTFWNDIVASREGPTISSIHLAFRACEVAPWGDQKAQEIWQRLVRTGIELDSAMWASYAAGLVGNGDVQSTARVLEEAYAGRVEIDTFM